MLQRPYKRRMSRKLPSSDIFSVLQCLFMIYFILVLYMDWKTGFQDARSDYEHSAGVAQQKYRIKDMGVIKEAYGYVEQYC